MPQKIGRYDLLRTLGSGAHSKVKLAVDSETQEKCAVKILKKNNINISNEFLRLVMTEVGAMS